MTKIVPDLQSNKPDPDRKPIIIRRKTPDLNLLRAANVRILIKNGVIVLANIITVIGGLVSLMHSWKEVI